LSGAFLAQPSCGCVWGLQGHARSNKQQNKILKYGFYKAAMGVLIRFYRVLIGFSRFKEGF
jgi:hypothetical protein